MQRSPDETIAIIERGSAMQAVLDSEAFKEVVDFLTSYHMAAIVACKPGYKADGEALAYHHTQQHALTEIVATLQQWAQSGLQAAQQLEFLREHGDND